jgi:hypothetical protein
MKPSTISAIVFVVLGIGFGWALLRYKWEADAMRPALEAGADATAD